MTDHEIKEYREALERIFPPAPPPPPPPPINWDLAQAVADALAEPLHYIGEVDGRPVIVA